MNEVNFYEPFMEEPAILPGRPLSEMDIVEYVQQHRRWALIGLVCQGGGCMGVSVWPLFRIHFENFIDPGWKLLSLTGALLKKIEHL